MKTTTTDNYQAQAAALANTLGVKLSFIGEPQYKKHFDSDKENRFVFKFKLSKGGKSYTFNFGQSINAGAEEPTIYDVLTCLQKHDVGSFEDFCWDFGFDTDSRTAERVYKGVCKEYEAMSRLFNPEELEELQEIQ